MFLLTVFGKGEKDNLTHAERNELRKVADAILRTYKPIVPIRSKR